MAPVRYHIWTAGCQMNVADSQRVASALEGLGYLPTAVAEQADVVVLNTCVVRQSAEDRAFGRLTSLRPLKERRPEVVINLMGCLVGVRGSPQLEASYPFVDVFSPPSDPQPLIDHLTQADGRSLDKRDTRRRYAAMDGDLLLPLHERGRLVSAHVPVVHGCSHACTFCIIPFRRGPERSRSVGQIVAEVRSLAEQGVREVTLLGQIVDRYGMDVPDGPNLSDLLRAVHRVDGIQRIRFLTSHPNWMSEQLLETVAELEKVCEHIEVPVQAGDDEVLRQMRRGYRADDYRRLIDHIRQWLPGASIATDIIVGFPGESDSQFQRTYDLLAELELDVAHLARYSARPRTVAARRLTDDVPEQEKMRRFQLLEDLQTGIAERSHRRLVGRELEVLVEGKRRGRWMGRSRTNKLVFFEAESEFAGQLVGVKIEHTGPWSLRGSLLHEPLSPQPAALRPLAVLNHPIAEVSIQ
ncbi:MAG TPA: tRNA (N6-isopentenyl adenosine(37)-C2)-methylthiotransferase MiaB [Anaerolineales bacterium]|nr:tRNA (N6-isopentenyl adenosine(37)-C2)-methylthiotransferase MiaB [Anaerolineales bacterium]